MLHKNAEIRKGGNAIRVDVTVNAHVPVNTGSPEWHGVLYPPNNTGLVMGETYMLVLPGYSPAKIVITSEANSSDGSVTFAGVGEVPHGKPSAQAQGAR